MSTTRRCHGYCRLPLAPGARTYLMIEPAGRLREFCDSDCLLEHYRTWLAAEVRRLTGTGRDA